MRIHVPAVSGGRVNIYLSDGPGRKAMVGAATMREDRRCGAGGARSGCRYQGSPESKKPRLQCAESIVDPQGKFRKFALKAAEKLHF